MTTTSLPRIAFLSAFLVFPCLHAEPVELDCFFGGARAGWNRYEEGPDGTILAESEIRTGAGIVKSRFSGTYGKDGIVRFECVLDRAGQEARIEAKDGKVSVASAGRTQTSDYTPARAVVLSASPALLATAVRAYEASKGNPADVEALLIDALGTRTVSIRAKRTVEIEAGGEGGGKESVSVYTLSTEKAPEMTLACRAGSIPVAFELPGQEFRAVAKGYESVLPPFPYRETEVSFANGGVTLSGTVCLPQGKGPFPGVAFTHGSGPSEGRAFAGLARAFARKGIASLRYDKRGCGKSTGDWLPLVFEDLTDDLLAGAKTLRSFKEVDPVKVGLWGVSQGGWIVTMAATRSADAAFIISVSGAGVTGMEQDRQRVLYELMANGFSREKSEEGASAYLALRDRLTDPARDEAEQVAAIEDARKNTWWGPHALPDIVPLAQSVRQFRTLRQSKSADLDPAPLLEKVSCPVLWIFGEKDCIVPVPENMPLVKGALEKGGNRDVTIKVFPGANHAIQLCKTGSLAEMVNDPNPRVAPGYLETMIGWILARAGSGRDPKEPE